MAGGKIFINYRRDDSRADSGRLFDRLVSRFPGKVFRDVASLEPGVEWHEAIARVLDQTDACIVVIGKDWVRITDAAGRRRLDDPRDTVRQEVVSALERKMRVFPVLVGGAKMPQEEELPADLRALCRRNALEITEQDWDEDFDKLLKALEVSLGRRSKPQEGTKRSRLTPWVSAAAATLAALIVLALYMMSYNSSSPLSGGQSVLLADQGNRPGPSRDSGSSNRADTGSQLVGTWRADVVELGIPMEIIWHVWPDATSSYMVRSGARSVTANTTWTYSNGIIYERSSEGDPSSGSINWIDKNHFVLTIIDNGDPRTRGLERHYSRL